MNKIIAQNRSKGFTLIELLVVIAIIAILAAILFPVFTNAKQAAHKVKCINNLKQLGNSLMLYMNDNNDTYPIWQFTTTDSWGTRLLKYSKSQQIFHCPDDPRPPLPEAIARGEQVSVTYFYNSMLNKDYDPMQTNQYGVYPLKPSEIRNTSKLIAIFDTKFRNNSKAFKDADRDFRAFNYGGKLLQHGFNGFAYVCTDGHSGYIKVKQGTSYNTLRNAQYTVRALGVTYMGKVVIDDPI